MTATALNGCKTGLLNYMHGQMFVVSAHRPCLPPFLSLLCHWEVASLVESEAVNFKLLSENGKVASLVPTQERVSLRCTQTALSASTWMDAIDFSQLVPTKI